MDKQLVILVDENDRAIGSEEKISAHKKGLLHRAFSVFIFNKKGELLVQKRAKGKYHSAGLWANSCCGHPRPGEDTVLAGERRLEEETGLKCKLKEAGHFRYETKFPNGLSENEFDHILVGFCDNEPVCNPDEIEEYRWVGRQELLNDLENEPEQYAVWFGRALGVVLKSGD